MISLESLLSLLSDQQSRIDLLTNTVAELNQQIKESEKATPTE